MDTSFDEIARTPVTADDLGRALDAISKLRARDRYKLAARARCLTILFSEDEPERDVAAFGTAIEWRLVAFYRLTGRPELEPWSLPGKRRGTTSFAPAVLKAAAEATLIFHDERPAFDPDSFFKRLLAISECIGRG
jgi:hypothetical protein